MIKSICMDSNKVVYSNAKDINPKNVEIDDENFITFYDSSQKKKCKTVEPWPAGKENFLKFVEKETNSAEIRDDFQKP